MSEAKSFRKHVLALLGEQYGDRTLVLCPTAFVKLLYGDHKAAILLSAKSSTGPTAPRTRMAGSTSPTPIGPPRPA